MRKEIVFAVQSIPMNINDVAEMIILSVFNMFFDLNKIQPACKKWQ